VVLVGIVAVRGLVLAVTLRKERLTGVASGEVPAVPVPAEATTERRPQRTRRLGRTTTTKTVPVQAPAEPATTRVLPKQDEDDEPTGPGYHLYRPSGQLPPDDDE